MLAQINKDVTTLCTIWQITRMDGVVLGLTDLDTDINIAGVTFHASAGYTRTAISTKQSLEVDNLDIFGILDSDYITAQDIILGKYDYASVQVAIYDYMNLSYGPIILRQGLFGECTVNPTGTFKVELRGLAQYLTTDTSNYFSPVCRADLGDSRCKIPIVPNPWTPNTVYHLNDYVRDSAPTDDFHEYAIYRATNNGTSAATQPAFDPTGGVITTESTYLGWISEVPYRYVGLVGSVTDRKTFAASAALQYRSTATYGRTATIKFKEGINSENVRISVTSDSVALEIDIPYDTHDLDSAQYCADRINGDSALQMSATVVNSGLTRDCNITNSTGNLCKVELLQADLNNVIISSFATGYMNGGLVSFVTGLNAGYSMEIYTYDQATETIVLFLNMPYDIAVGDKFTYQAGCDKARTTCQEKFLNILNFRGEPDAPGSDGFLLYPDSQQKG